MTADEHSVSANAIRYLVCGQIVDPATNEITCDDKVVRIEPKSMEVLVFLFDRAGEVVSREQIQDAIWSDVVVGDDSLTNAIIKIRRAFGDDARAPKVIETIPKRGYRLIAEVGAAPDKQHSTKSVGRTLIAVTTLISFALVAIGMWVFQTEPDVSAPSATLQDSRTRIAVAQFINLSGDPAQDYLATGVEQTILTGLAANPQVVAIQVTAKTAKADYLLEGSIQRYGDHIRVDTRLLDAQDGTVIAVQRFDRTFFDLLAVQAEIEQTIIKVLALDIEHANLASQSLGYTDSVQAYDLFLKAQALLLQRNLSGNTEARELYRRAISRDPSFARAYAGLALAHAADYRNGWTADENGSLEKALSMAQTALAIQPNLPEQYWVIGYVRTQQRRLDDAEEALNNALRLDKDYADAVALLGGIQTYAGRPDKTLALLHEAMRLEPRAGYLYFLLLGRAYYFIGDCPLALINLNEAASRNPSNLETHVYLAACMVQMENLEAAEWEIEEILGNDPGFSLASFFQSYPMVAEHQIVTLMRDLRRAGAS